MCCHQAKLCRYDEDARGEGELVGRGCRAAQAVEIMIEEPPDAVGVVLECLGGSRATLELARRVWG